MDAQIMNHQSRTLKGRMQRLQLAVVVAVAVATAVAARGVHGYCPPNKRDITGSLVVSCFRVVWHNHDDNNQNGDDGDSHVKDGAAWWTNEVDNDVRWSVLDARVGRGGGPLPMIARRNANELKILTWNIWMKTANHFLLLVI